MKCANEAGALAFSIHDAPAGGNETETIRADKLNATLVTLENVDSPDLWANQQAK